MRLLSALTVFFASLALPALPQAAPSHESQRVKLFRHHSTTAWSCSSAEVQAFVYESGFAVDADGAYRAYHPDDRLGLDSIEHAGHPGNWWALATDTGSPDGHPVIQGRNDPAPGYYVSMTALFDSRIGDEHNPRRFVDAATIPYVVLPPKGFKHARLGDFAMVMNLESGKRAGAIVADASAPDLPMGEGSIALAQLLDIDPNARTGGTDRGVVYVIYPGSGNGEPRPLGVIDRLARANFEKWGGLPKLKSCLR
ncbi:MAG TPA: glycoside hydrolase family 75 protein [Terracidiphilus sp.]|nr:glycoside hydrolase family 75 protein [Terracidiphilus sp.]